MPDDLDHAPRVRSVEPTMVPALESFACGGPTAYEAEVEHIVNNLRLGQYPWATLRVAENPADGSLLGLCAIHPRDLGTALDAAYVFVIGVNGPYRGRRTPDGSRLGDVLLADALEQINRQWGDGPMPPVWAVIESSNAASHNLFDRHGFILLPNGGDYDIRYRPREEP